MTGPAPGRPRAFRFAGAGFDSDAGGGLATTPAGGIEMVEGDDAVRQALMLLLSTVPGERLLRPTYGSHLHRLLFAVNDQTTAGLAIHYVRQAVQRWEPRVAIVEVDAGQDPEVASRLTITLTYRVRASMATETLVYPLDLAEGEPS